MLCIDLQSVFSLSRFIHRLDYATSGVICIALTKKGAQKGNKAFQERKVTKHYLALVSYVVSFDSIPSI